MICFLKSKLCKKRKMMDNIKKNFSWHIIYEVVATLLAFLAPRFIIMYYGSEINGLNTTILQIVRVLTLLQAGICTASIFELYKPIANKDYEEVSRKLSEANQYLTKVGILFFTLNSITALLAALLIDTEIKSEYVFISFIIIGIKYGFDIIFTSKFNILFTAVEKRRYYSIGLLIEQVIYYILLFIILFLNLHFILMFNCLLIGCIAKILYFNKIYEKKFSYKITKEKTKLNKIPSRKYSMINEIAHSASNASVTIIVSFMYGLKEASVFSVYFIVIKLMNMISEAMYSAFAPTYGNKCACSDTPNSNEMFIWFQTLFVTVNTIIYMCVAVLIIPFVKIYMAGAADTDYINKVLAIAMVFYGVFYCYRIPHNVLVSTHGLFKETYMQTAIAAPITIILSCLFGTINISYILIGPILFNIANLFYQQLKLKQMIPVNLNHTINLIMMSLTCTVGAILFMNFVKIRIESIFEWILAAIICLVASLIILFLVLSLFFKNEFKTYIKHIKKGDSK